MSCLPHRGASLTLTCRTRLSTMRRIPTATVGETIETSSPRATRRQDHQIRLVQRHTCQHHCTPTFVNFARHHTNTAAVRDNEEHVIPNEGSPGEAGADTASSSSNDDCCDSEGVAAEPLAPPSPACTCPCTDDTDEGLLDGALTGASAISSFAKMGPSFAAPLLPHSCNTQRLVSYFCTYCLSHVQTRQPCNSRCTIKFRYGS
jgi:hypothetical protein